MSVPSQYSLKQRRQKDLCVENGLKTQCTEKARNRVARMGSDYYKSLEFGGKNNKAQEPSKALHS